MGKALYRKHRPKKLSEVVGQPHVTDTLSRALEQGKLSHAYLLTGPRGVGKTSIARIIAYEANGLPYDEDGSHLDIIEIDAASNRRIDEIRELKERINIAPTSAKYKVYIIDEVHMLTKEAFNALLKTLEEPPEHAIFILATTEAHKVPQTIVSRTQRFSLKPIDTTLIATHLGEVAKEEKIDISTDALTLIAEHGEGSFRDSLSLLDQISHDAAKIERENVERALGVAPKMLLEELLAAVQGADLKKVSEVLEDLRNQGVQAQQATAQLIALLRSDLLESKSNSSVDSLELMSRLLEVSSAQDQSLALELALYESCLNHTKGTTKPKTSSPDKVIAAAPVVQPDAQATSSQPAPQKIEGILELNPETWANVLNTLKSKHNTLYSVARMATPEFQEGKIVLIFSFAFHRKKLADPVSQQLLKEIIKQTTGQAVTLEFVLQKPEAVNDEVVEPEAPSVNLETISNIFGGAEIVE